MRAHDFEQLEMFQAAASEAFVPLRIDVPEDVGFRATFGSKKINELPITTIAGTACSVRRDARTIGSSDPELVKVALHRRGLAGVEQDGRQCLLNPGDLVAYATARPYELRYWDDFETTVIAIPRSRLGLGAELIGQRSAVRLPTGPGVSSVVSTCLTGLAGSLGEVSGPAAMYLADALVSLVVSAFTEGSSHRDEPTSHLADRILAYCLANLADPALSVESVARRHGISVRYLHKVIARRGTSLAAWIRRERLLRIHRDLSNPALANRTTSEIAARWGILDPTHLGRSLKAEFGRTVTEIRRRAGS